ncbi:hypothetical protein KAT08_03760 [Candidatus Babeliales bacterium]|nr:hypothetical protein [Candidatus Babeliales bacterium]
MKIGCSIFLFFSIIFFQSLLSKEILVDASSSVNQIKFVVKSGDLVFTEKYQNINGKITHTWYINNDSVSKDDYFNRMSKAEQEEKDITREDEQSKKEEEERKKREEEEEKKREQEEFLNEVRVQALKKMVKLELDGVENSFAKLEKYKLDEHFIFEEETFSSLYSFEQTKVSLINNAREIVIRSKDKSSQNELKEMLAKLEPVPAKIERFFRKSVKFAIDKCNDTKRLKELLALI